MPGIAGSPDRRPAAVGPGRRPLDEQRQPDPVCARPPWRCDRARPSYRRDRSDRAGAPAASARSRPSGSGTGRRRPPAADRSGRPSSGRPGSGRGRCRQPVPSAPRSPWFRRPGPWSRARRRQARRRAALWPASGPSTAISSRSRSVSRSPASAAQLLQPRVQRVELQGPPIVGIPVDDIPGAWPPDPPTGRASRSCLARAPVPRAAPGGRPRGCPSLSSADACR